MSSWGSGGPTQWAPTPKRSRSKLDNLRRFADDVIGKARS